MANFDLRRADIRYGVFSLALVGVILFAGQVATFPNLAPWYATLVKPPFNPPSWIFGPVWGALYLLMALALWRLLRRPASRARRTALLWFFLQIALNAAWSWMFFAAHSPLLGLINIVPQWLAIIAAIVAGARVDRMAAWCLAPLAAWVAFAAVLNAALVWLNG